MFILGYLGFELLKKVAWGTLREYTSIYEAGNIRYQESHCTDYDSYGENDPI
jgi:hypothetical protein